MSFFYKFIFIVLVPLTLSAAPYSRRSRISKDLDVFEQDEISYRKSIITKEKIVVNDFPSKYYTSSYHKRKIGDEVSVQQLKNNDSKLLEVKTIDFDFGISTGYINGDTTYHISFDNPYLVGGHGESKLEFPLDNSLFGLSTSLTFKDRDFVLENGKLRKRSKIEFKWLTNLSQKSGKMKDSDWIENDIGYIAWYNAYYGTAHIVPAVNHDGLDIYSESDTELDMDIFDISYTHDIYLNDKFAFSPLFGYYYRNMRFKAGNTYQYGYGPYAPMFTATVPGLAIEYDILYKFVYFGFKTDLIVKKSFNFTFRFAYSPWVNASDKDIHVAAGSWSESTADGEAYMINLDGNWKLKHGWMLNLGYEFSDFDIGGFQYQSGGGNPQNSISLSSWLASLGLNYSF